LLSNVTIIILAFGAFFVIVTAGIDLSVGSLVALSGCLLAGFVEAGISWWLSIIYVLLIMLIPGIVNGFFVAFGKMNAFIATLAMMSIARGLAYIYVSGSPKIIFDDNILAISDIEFLNGWLPLPLLILLIIFLISMFVLQYTSYGRKLYAIGDDPESAYLNGIPVKKYVFSVYIINSFLAAVAGIILTSRLLMGSPLVGQSYEMDAIASVIIGGGALYGGTGTIGGTLLGALIFGILQNIFNLAGIGGYPQMILKGLIIIAALLFYRKKKK
jgi:ribose transport system permease protein